VVVAVEDDGAGVDLVAVRRRAVDARLLSREAAEALDDTSALALLVVPGLTTAPEADLLAGRGLGLDVVQSAVRRLGGSLRLSSRRHRGFTARIDVPGELGLTRVLWVEADGETYAIPAVAARRVHLRRDMAGRAVMPLATCLDGQPRDGTPLVVELDPADPDGGDTPVAVGVDAVGRTEDLLLRPLSPLVTGIGPYAGVVVRQDGALHLALDVDALVPRLRGSPA
jgi:two-component system chemotaxis sensor kinase CheA